MNFKMVSESQQTLIENHIPLVKHVAKHFAMRLPPVVQLDDLIQAGMVGLIEAAQHYQGE